MRMIDITMPIYEGMGQGSVFPEETEFIVEDITTYEDNLVRLVRLTMFQEPGTRLMLGSIMAAHKDERKVDEIPLPEIVLKDACILHLPAGERHGITAEEVRASFNKSSAQKGDALLFHTGWGDNERYLELKDNYPLRSPWFTDGACDTIVEIFKANGSNIFGYDTANCMDYKPMEGWWGQTPRPKNWPSAEAKAYLKGVKFTGEKGTLYVMDSGVTLLGGIVNLGEIKKERVKLIALPLKLKGLGGGPTRAVVIEE